MNVKQKLKKKSLKKIIEKSNILTNSIIMKNKFKSQINTNEQKNEIESKIYVEKKILNKKNNSLHRNNSEKKLIKKFNLDINNNIFIECKSLIRKNKIKQYYKNINKKE
jgi:hypothetical protein